MLFRMTIIRRTSAAGDPHKRVTLRIIAATSAILVPLALATACSSPASTPSGSGSASGGSDGGTITVGLPDAPDALDPTTASTLVGRIVFVNMCQKLYDINSSLTLVPQLAAALPQVSADGLSYTIQLKPNVKFNDGTPLNAQAVVTTLNWYLTNPLSVRASELHGVQSVKATGPLTVVIGLSKPFAPLTSILADRSGMILSPTQLKKLGNNFSKDPVCVGPFEFSSRPSLDTIDLVKSPYYYGKAHVHLAKVIFQVVSDQSAMAADLESGGIQVAYNLAPQQVSSVENNAQTKIQSVNSLGYQGLDFNVGNVHGSLKTPGIANNPFAKYPSLRQAFEDSMDRQQLNQVAFGGLYTPGCTPIPPNSPWAVPVTCPAQDIAQAKALIKATGLATPIHVTLMVDNTPLSVQVGTVIQAMAKQAGFAVALQPTEFTTALTKAENGDYEMFQVGWSGRIDPDQNIYSDWYPKSGLNYTGANYPALDTLLTQARESTSDAARHTLYTQIVNTLESERNIIYLWYDKFFTGLRKNVTGVQYYSDSLIRLENAQLG